MKFSKAVSGLFSRITVSALCLTVLFILPSCSELLDDEDYYESGSSSVSIQNDKPSSSSADVHGKTYATEPDSGFERISKAYIYSAWYDIEKDNPVDYSSIDSNDAYAMKCVFYFNEPVSGTFRAVLKRDGEQVSVKQIRLDGKVIAECDFSAGLEGLGSFRPGSYKVYLETENKNVAVSDEMRVN